MAMIGRKLRGGVNWQELQPEGVKQGHEMT